MEKQKAEQESDKEFDGVDKFLKRCPQNSIRGKRELKIYNQNKLGVKPNGKRDN